MRFASRSRVWCTHCVAGESHALHAAGAVAEIFGIHISLILLIPGGLFELALAFWLLIKGFQPEAYQQAGG